MGNRRQDAGGAGCGQTGFRIAAGSGRLIRASGYRWSGVVNRHLACCGVRCSAACNCEVSHWFEQRDSKRFDRSRVPRGEHFEQSRLGGMKSTEHEAAK